MQIVVSIIVLIYCFASTQQKLIVIILLWVFLSQFDLSFEHKKCYKIFVWWLRNSGLMTKTLRRKKSFYCLQFSFQFYDAILAYLL